MVLRFCIGGLIMTMLCACGESISGGSTSATTAGAGGGGATSSAGTGGNSPAGCANAALCNGIYLPSTCDSFGTGSGGSGGSGGSTPDAATVAEMRCALTKLRDHEAGYVSLFVESHAGTGCGIRTEIVSFGDGSASVRQMPWADIGVTPGTPVRVALESKAYFDACLAGSNDKLADCVMAMTTNTAVAGPTCPCRGVPGAQDGQCMAP